MLHSRKKRVEGLIQEEVAWIISQMKDPRLGMVTVTSVKLSSDLRLATIYVTVLRQEKKEETMEILQKAQKFIRHELGTRIVIKYLPDIRFRYDETLERASRINELLSELDKEKTSADDQG